MVQVICTQWPDPNYIESADQPVQTCSTWETVYDGKVVDAVVPAPTRSCIDHEPEGDRERCFAFVNTYDEFQVAEVAVAPTTTAPTTTEPPPTAGPVVLDDSQFGIVAAACGLLVFFTSASFVASFRRR